MSAEVFTAERPQFAQVSSGEHFQIKIQLKNHNIRLKYGKRLKFLIAKALISA
jgi:hypothetical protein